MKKIDFTLDYLNNLPKTREEALAIGSKYYFNGLCKKGHLSPILTNNNECFICKRERTRISAEKRRRKLGISIQNSVKPLIKGMVFESLTATGRFKTEFTKNRKKNRNINFHEVVCICGKKYWMRAENWGKINQCVDCSLKKMSDNNIIHDLSQKIEGSLYYSAKIRAKKSKIDFNIEITDIIIPDKCPILNIKIDKRMGMSKNREPRFNAPSLDRINSNLGYVKGNIIVMCYKANVLKKDGTSEEHLKVAEYMEKMGVKK